MRTTAILLLSVITIFLVHPGVQAQEPTGRDLLFNGGNPTMSTLFQAMRSSRPI